MLQLVPLILFQMLTLILISVRLAHHLALLVLVRRAAFLVLLDICYKRPVCPLVPPLAFIYKIRAKRNVILVIQFAKLV